jgi:hypothetical protein
LSQKLPGSSGNLKTVKNEKARSINDPHRPIFHFGEIRYLTDDVYFTRTLLPKMRKAAAVEHVKGLTGEITVVALLKGLINDLYSSIMFHTPPPPVNRGGKMARKGK